MEFTIDTGNKEFQDALNLIQYTRQSVFLTGKAGTGKSTFLKYICKNTKKKHIVLAPTGIAAINAGGSTLHSFFKLPFHPLLPDDPNLSLQRGRIHEFFKYTKPHRKLLEQVELVIIDEISMVRADMIDAVDRILRVYSRNLRDPFGGKQVLLVGDVFQLEPVIKGDEREIINRFYPTPYFSRHGSSTRSNWYLSSYRKYIVSQMQSLSVYSTTSGAEQQGQLTFSCSTPAMALKWMLRKKIYTSLWLRAAIR